MAYRLGVLGLASDRHAWNFMNQFAQTGKVEFVAVAEAEESLREKARSEFGFQRAYADYRQCLAQEDLDCVFVTSAYDEHGDMAVAAAERKVAILMDKPFGATLAQVEAALTAVREHEVLLLVNWPFGWSPAIVKAQELLHAGAIGEVFFMRVDSAFPGPREAGVGPSFSRFLFGAGSAGGTIADMGAYSASQVRQFMGGVPLSVVGMAGRFVKQFMAREDNAVALLRYPSAIAEIRASWTHRGGPTGPSPLLCGSRGTIAVYRRRMESYLDLTVEPSREPERIECDPQPAHKVNGVVYFLHCLETGEPPENVFTGAWSRDAQEILEAWRLSVLQERTIHLPLTSYVYGSL